MGTMVPCGTTAVDAKMGEHNGKRCAAAERVDKSEARRVIVQVLDGCTHEVPSSAEANAGVKDHDTVGSEIQNQNNYKKMQIDST
jgi:hypothetical protein